jgi:hypothetical protein
MAERFKATHVFFGRMTEMDYGAGLDMIV